MGAGNPVNQDRFVLTCVPYFPKSVSNYFSSGGYPIGDVEFLIELGGYQNNRMGFEGR
jgi:hypothetical protein